MDATMCDCQIYHWTIFSNPKYIIIIILYGCASAEENKMEKKRLNGKYGFKLIYPRCIFIQFEQYLPITTMEKFKFHPFKRRVRCWPWHFRTVALVISKHG